MMKKKNTLKMIIFFAIRELYSEYDYLCFGKFYCTDFEEEITENIQSAPMK